MSDIDERLEEEIIHASRKSFDSQQAGINANFLMDIQREIERLRADLAAVTAERDAFAARLAPVEDEELVDIAAETWIEATTGMARRPSTYTISERAGARNVIAAIRPHIEAAERERCAKVAEGFSSNRDWVPGSLWGNIRNEIAAAIRSGSGSVK